MQYSSETKKGMQTLLTSSALYRDQDKYLVGQQDE